MSKPSPSQPLPDLLPDAADVRFYREHGYYITNRILPDRLLDAALAASERLYRGERDSEPPAGATPGWQPGDGPRVLRKNDFAWLQLTAMAALVRHPLLGAAAARLAGEPVRLWQDQLLCKPSDGREAKANVGWHTDRLYWRCCTSTEMLTAWIPFRDYSATDGTVTFIDGSHRWSDNDDSLDFSEFNFRNQDLDRLGGRFDVVQRPIVKVPLDIKRGQVSFHHCKTIHGSGPNRGPLPRTALAVHMQPASNRWCAYEYRMPDGSIRHHDMETLCRKIDGVADFADPALCPMLWPLAAS